MSTAAKQFLEQKIYLSNKFRYLFEISIDYLSISRYFSILIRMSYSTFDTFTVLPILFLKRSIARSRRSIADSKRNIVSYKISIATSKRSTVEIFPSQHFRYFRFFSTSIVRHFKRSIYEESNGN